MFESLQVILKQIILTDCYLVSYVVKILSNSNINYIKGLYLYD